MGTGGILLLIFQPSVEGGLALGWACMCRIIMGFYVYVYVIGLPRVSLHSAVFGRVLCPVHGHPTYSGGGAMGEEQKSTPHCCTGEKTHSGLAHIGVNLPNLPELSQMCMNGVGFAVAFCVFNGKSPRGR